MKKYVILLISLFVMLIPANAFANIMCNDGSISPSCGDCHRGCCSHHGGCASSYLSNRSTVKKSKKAKIDSYNNVSSSYSNNYTITTKRVTSRTQTSSSTNTTKATTKYKTTTKYNDKNGLATSVSDSSDSSSINPAIPVLLIAASALGIIYKNRKQE